MLTQNRYGEVIADVEAVAGLLAKHMGLALDVRKDDLSDYVTATLENDFGVVVSLSTQYPNRKRVQVHIDLSLKAMPQTVRANGYWREKMGHCTFDPTRPIAQIAKEITKKFAESQPAIEERRAAVKRHEEHNSAQARATAEALRVLPEGSVRLPAQHNSNGEASFYYAQDGLHISGRVQPGGLYLERVSGLTMEEIALIIASRRAAK